MAQICSWIILFTTSHWITFFVFVNETSTNNSMYCESELMDYDNVIMCAVFTVPIWLKCSNLYQRRYFLHWKVHFAWGRVKSSAEVNSILVIGFRSYSVLKATWRYIDAHVYIMYTVNVGKCTVPINLCKII